MKIIKRTYQKGITLIEVLLVLVIAGSIIYAIAGYMQQRTLSLQIDRTTLQMQQVLNAGLAYYINNGQWPPSATNVDCLKGLGGSGCIGTVAYLPVTFGDNPWNVGYSIASSTNTGVFYVYTRITAATGTTGSATAAANIIAGKLPLAYTTRATTGAPPTGGLLGLNACLSTTTSCAVVASVNIPGQNLNNASAMNFAGVYHHGGCVPVPACPVDANGTTMTPQIFVVPVSVSGVNDPSNNTTVYPISSFTAYATGGNNSTPPICIGGSAPPCNPIGTSSNNRYWRACVQIITEKGEVTQTRSDDWGAAVTLGAFTRCAISGEPSGSPLTVFGN